MAEFTEVVKQARRLCKYFGEVRDDCKTCPLASDEGTYLCNVIDLTADFSGEDYDRFASIVMKWATEHPEPKYPTWCGMWKQLFPTAECVPCIKVAIGNEYKPKEGCDKVRCDVCKMRHIPADIAKKLGIEPIGGERHA